MSEITRHTKLEDLPEYIRVEEYARWVDISRGTAYAMAKRGELPTVRFGRLLRIKRDGLQQAVTR